MPSLFPHPRPAPLPLNPAPATVQAWGHTDSLHSLMAQGVDVMDHLDALLRQGVNLNACDEHHRTALHVAAWNHHHPLVDGLLQAGAQADLRDEEGGSALFDLIEGKPLNQPAPLPLAEDLLPRMVTAGADPNGVRWLGWSHFAQENLGNDLPLADGRWLEALANGQPLDPQAVPSRPDDPATTDQVWTVLERILVSALSSGRVQRQTPLALAVRTGNTRMFNALLATGADPLQPVGHGARSNLLHAISLATPFDMIDRLLDLGVPIDAHNHTGHTPAELAGAQKLVLLERHLNLRQEQRELRAIADAAQPAFPGRRERARL